MAINKNIDLRSEEVQEILGTPPRWIVRRGITIMFCVVVTLVAGSYFYKYPDILSSRVTILSENPPVQIVAKSNGKIDKLFVQNNEEVRKGDVLAVIENTANYDDACRLLSQLETIGALFESPELFSKVFLTENFSLGQYHSFFSSFISQLRNYQTFLNFNTYNQRIESLKNQVTDYNLYYERAMNQTAVLKQDYELAMKKFIRDSTLFNQNIMSEVDFEDSKAGMLRQKYSWQNAMTSLANTRITMNNLTQQIQEQEVLKSEAASQNIALLKERYDNLVNELVAWEQAYVLKTPIDGQITFTNFWSMNQFVNTGDVVFTIVPRQDQKIVGRAVVPIAGAGKVEVGQQVNIKLDNYPHIEFGIVEGKISNISKVPVITDGRAFYTAEITLVEQLNTNYNRQLPFNQEMQGTGEIITRDRRLLERLTEPVVSVIRENF